MGDPLTRRQNQYANRAVEALETIAEAFERIADMFEGSPEISNSPTYCDGGAIAEANCIRAPDCEWRGQVVYRLVDLAGGAMRNGESAVTTGKVTPTYYPYETDS